MAKKKQTVKETLPVEEQIQEVDNEVVEQSVVEEKTELVVPEEETKEPEIEENVEEQTEEELINEETIDPEKILEEFNEKTKDIDNFVTSNTTQEELTQKFESELERVDDVEEKLQKQINELESKITPEMKKRFTQFWMGASEGWFN